MIDQEQFDLFKPYGTDEKHICKNCKHCFSFWGSNNAYCNNCGFVTQEQFACSNMYDEYTDGHVNYSNGYKNQEWRNLK